MKSRALGARLIFASTFVLALGALPRPAMATSFSLYDTYQWAGGAGQSGQSSGIQGTTPAPILSLDLPTINESFNDGIANSGLSMRGSATPGQLHAFASATATTTDTSGVDGISGGAGSTVELSFFSTDTLTLQSSTLSIGAPVSYTLEYVLDSTLGATGTMFDRCNPATTPVPTAIFLTGVGNTTELIRSPCGAPGFGSDHMVAMQTLTTPFGTPVNIQEGLTVQGQVGAGFGNPDSSESLTLNAADTGSLYVIINTPNVTFTSASGATYQPTSTTAVPEPTTLTLTALGLAGLVGRYRRRRASR